MNRPGYRSVPGSERACVPTLASACGAVDRALCLRLLAAVLDLPRRSSADLRPAGEVRRLTLGDPHGVPQTAEELPLDGSLLRSVAGRIAFLAGFTAVVLALA